MPSLGDLMVRVGAEIDPSFNSTMDTTSGKLGEFSDKAGSVGDAWQTASGKITDALPDVANLGEAAETASKGVSDMVEQLLALGEALAITEAMKELAADALTIYGNVEKASTSLTALTGNAGTAKGVIEGLKDLALNDALSFPALLQASQKMSGLGLSAGEIIGTLGTAANAAAALGTDVGSVADAIDRMVLSGNASPKMLATLGISTGTLGTAMGTLSGNVTDAFKALDQSDRLEAINTALSKFSGVALTTAQSIAGQWQILKTQWEGIMEAIGADLAPVATQILQFLSTNAIPFFQNMIDGFNNLSPGMQQFIGATLAAGPAIAALSLGIAGAGAALTALAGIGELAGPIALVAAALEGIHLSGMDTAAMNLYHAIADNFPDLTGLFGNIGAAIESAAGKFGTWSSGILNQTPLIAGGFQSMQSDLDRILPSISKTDIAGWLKAAADPAAMLKIGVNELADAVQYLGGNYTSMGTAAATALGKVVGANDQLNQQMATQAGGFTSVTVSVNAIGKAYETLKQNLTDAQTKLGEVKTAFDNGQASLGQYAAAQGDVERAQIALNPNFVTQKQAVADLNTATSELNNSQTTLSGLLNSLPRPILSVVDAQNGLRLAVANSETAAGGMAEAQQKLNAAIALGPGHTKELADAVNGMKDAETKAKDAKTGLEQATKDMSAAQGLATKAAKDQATTDSDYATMLNTLAKPAVSTYMDAFGNLSKARSDYYNAASTENTIQAQVNQLLADGKQGTTDYKNAEGALAAAHGVVEQKQKDVNAAQSSANQILADLKKGSTDLTSAEQALADLYQRSLVPNAGDLAGALQRVRDAKTNVTTAAGNLTTAENNYKDTLMDLLLGGASLGDYEQAIEALNTSKVKLKDNVKLLDVAEGNLTSTFGVSKQTLKDVSNDTSGLSTAAQNAKAGFDALKIQSSSDLDDLAAKAHSAFLLIQGSGTGSSADIRQAWIADLTAEKAALVSNGSDLTTVQQTTLTSLLNQQTDYLTKMKDPWHDFYTTVEGDVSQLSDKLLTDLFTGSNSFGKDAINELEKIAAAFVNTLIQPVTQSIGKFLAGALTDLGKGFTQLGSTATQTGTTIADVFGYGSSGAGAAASGAAGGGSTVSGILSAVSSTLSGIVGAVAGIVTAVSSVIGNFQMAHMNDTLNAMEKETARMAIYLGDQGANSILGLMWRLAADLEFGMMEKDLNIIAPDMDTVVKALGNLTVNASGSGGGGSSSISGVVTVNDPGNTAYLPTTQTNPIPFTNIDDALNNYQKVITDYVAGKASADDVTAAQQAVALAQTLAAAQKKYQDDINAVFSGKPGALTSADLAADKQAVIDAHSVTTAGPSTQITTVGELYTANQALANINTTLQFSVGLNPWFQTAFQNINDGIVACAGWLQGIAGIMGAVQAEIPTLGQVLGNMPGGSDGSGDGGSAGDGSATSTPTADTDAMAGRNIAKIADLIDGWTGTLRSHMQQLDHGIPLDALNDAFKFSISVPKGIGSSGIPAVAPTSLAGAGAAGNIEIHFHNSVLTSEEHVRKALDKAFDNVRAKQRGHAM